NARRNARISLGPDNPIQLRYCFTSLRNLGLGPVGGSVRSRASWRMTHGQGPRECEVSRYRHGCDPPELAEPVLDCDTAPFSQRSVSDPPYVRPYLSLMLVLSAPSRIGLPARLRREQGGPWQKNATARNVTCHSSVWLLHLSLGARPSRCCSPSASRQ